MNPSANNQWSRLNPLQVGKYAEYLTKMEFTKNGLEVFSPEIDDHGIDLIILKTESEKFYEVQVKSVRDKTNYIYLTKEKLKNSHNILVAVVLFNENQSPKMFLIPIAEWDKPNSLLVDHEYENKKSKPEYGINISKKNMELLNKYPFDKTLNNL